MKRGRSLFLRSGTAKWLITIGLALIASSVIVSGVSFDRLKTLNEQRASLADIRSDLYEVNNTTAQYRSAEAKLILEFLQLKEQAMTVTGPQEKIDQIQADIQQVEIDRDRIDVQIEDYQAQAAALEAGISAVELKIIMWEQAADLAGKISGILLSVGMLLFSSGLAVYLYLSRKRA